MTDTRSNSLANTPAEIMASDSDIVRIVQITDSHIFADPDGCLLGLNTRESFRAVRERVEKEEWRPDIMLSTGDLSQDASPQAYQYLADQFQAMDIPTYWCAGNHDNPDVMELYLSNSRVSSAKVVYSGNWQIILLDSSVKGKVHGLINEEQLAFLKSCLANAPQRNALVVFHHQPVNVGSKWLDNVGLLNKQAFLDVVKAHSQIKGVLWGHVHQEYDQKENGVHWLATPSSCVQFKVQSQEFSAGNEAPGYRYLNLHSDGRIETVVHRIDNIEFTVDYTIKGY